MYFNKFVVRKIIVLIVSILTTLLTHEVNGQISLADPSFEEDYTYIISATDQWIYCEGSPDKWVANQYEWMFNPDPSDGMKYLGMATPYLWNSDLHESISSNLVDTLIQGSNYYFDFDIAYLLEITEGLVDQGKVDIYLGNGACDLSQKITTCIAHDAIWETQRVHFTPNANYTSLTLRTEFIDSIGANYVLIDNFSSIFNSDELSTSHNVQPSHIQVASIIGTKQFTINLASFDNDRFSFCFHSCNGRVLWQNIDLDLGLNIFTTDNLPSGIYFVVIKDSLTGIKSAHAVNSM